MGTLKIFFVLIVTALFFGSAGITRATEKRVEAENMKLTHYKIAGNDSSAHIKLTDSTGIAAFNFDLPSGKYNIDVRYLSESVGQNTYTMYIADNQIIAWLGKDRDDKWHRLSEQTWHIPKNIEINNGDEIRIEALSENGSLAVFDYIEFTSYSRQSSSNHENLITIFPDEYPGAIRNPLKGFRASKQDHEYSTLMKSYIKWNELENSVNDDVKKINDFCDKKWIGIEKSNLKVIPRVYLAWSGNKQYWPSDMTPGDFTSDQFNKSFKNKLVMIRWPNTYDDHIYNFGYYWDSFAHHDQKYYAYHLNNTAPKWKTAVIGGETAYNWGNLQKQPGESPEESLTEPVHRDYIIDRIRKLHANHVGWIANYDQSDERVRAGAEIMQKALGYRFVISEVSYPKRIDAGTQFAVSFKVKNTGSSPFYYDWPVEISLFDEETRKVVWKKQLEEIDIRTWLPGDKWNETTKEYTIPAKTYTINQTLQLPDINPEEYILALAILDPGGNLPCARFAIKNYYNGGRHPIGKVGINRTIGSFSASEFDDLQSDKSLFYRKVVE